MRLKNEEACISINPSLSGHMLKVKQVFEISKLYPHLDLLDIRDAVFNFPTDAQSNIESIFRKTGKFKSNSSSLQ